MTISETVDAAKAPNLMKLLEFYGVKNEAGIIVETDRIGTFRMRRAGAERYVSPCRRR